MGESARRHPRQPRPRRQEGEEGRAQALDRQEADLRGQEAEGGRPEERVSGTVRGPGLSSHRLNAFLYDIYIRPADESGEINLLLAFVQQAPVKSCQYSNQIYFV